MIVRTVGPGMTSRTADAATKANQSSMGRMFALGGDGQGSAVSILAYPTGVQSRQASSSTRVEARPADREARRYGDSQHRDLILCVSMLCWATLNRRRIRGSREKGWVGMIRRSWSKCCWAARADASSVLGLSLCPQALAGDSSRWRARLQSANPAGDRAGLRGETVRGDAAALVKGVT